MAVLSIDEFMKEAKSLPGEIRSFQSRDRFIAEFRDVFSAVGAREEKNIIYAFTCNNEIPRVKGQSPIAYIGKTKSTLYGRYSKYATTFANEDNWPFYRFIIEKYGPMKILYIVLSEESELKAVESALLTDYFHHHHDYPPKNSSRG
jgi:hypothetical protein